MATTQSRAANWRTVLICTAALAAIGGPVATAGAADTVTITNPEPGSRHLIGYDGPVAVDFTGVTEFGDYTVSVTGPDAYSWQVTWTYDGSQHTNNWSFDPTPVAGTYRVAVENQDTAEVAATETFRVDDVHVTESRLASTTFFPLEHDGHKDFAHFLFRTDVRARDTIRVTNRRGRVIRRVRLGALSGERLHRWNWDGRDGRGHLVRPGRYGIHVTAMHGVARDAGATLSVALEALPVHITRRHVGPSPFFPIERDGFRDRTTFRFRTSLRAVDLVQVATRSHRLVRNERLGSLAGHTTHAWVWNGRDGRGHRLRAGTYRVRVVARHFDQKAKSHWIRVVIARRHRR